MDQTTTFKNHAQTQGARKPFCLSPFKISYTFDNPFLENNKNVIERDREKERKKERKGKRERGRATLP